MASFGYRKPVGKCRRGPSSRMLTRRKTVANEVKQLSSETSARRLMKRVAGGDEAAFAELLHLCHPLVLTAVQVFIPNRPQADRVVEQVFVALGRSAPDFDPRKSDVRPWLLDFVLVHTLRAQNNHLP
jgi:hypothetical protein